MQQKFNCVAEFRLWKTERHFKKFLHFIGLNIEFRENWYSEIGYCETKNVIVSKKEDEHHHLSYQIKKLQSLIYEDFKQHHPKGVQEIEYLLKIYHKIEENIAFALSNDISKEFSKFEKYLHRIHEVNFKIELFFSIK
ncbi:MAG: hypothetical protein WCG91_00600 [Candidatus Shapirobacteria bacterium]